MNKRRLAMNKRWLLMLVSLTPIFLGGSSPNAQQNLKTDVKVIDFDDEHVPVKSQIFAQKPGDISANTWLADTDDQGIAAPIVCAVGDRLVAKPVSASYYHSRAVACTAHAQIKVMSRQILESERRKAREAKDSGDWKVQGLILNDLAARERILGLDSAKEDELEAYKATAKALNVAQGTVMDPLQGKSVMSPTLRDAVSGYQKSVGLTPTGSLDNKTLSTLSGTSVQEVLLKRPGGSP